MLITTMSQRRAQWTFFKGLDAVYCSLDHPWLYGFFFLLQYSILNLFSQKEKKKLKDYGASAVTSVVSDSVRPHRWQPTRLPCSWDSPGKNTGVGCHFLLQWVKVKSEREVTESYPILCDPMDCSLPGPSAHGIFQARVLSGLPLPSLWRTINFVIKYSGQL